MRVFEWKTRRRVMKVKVHFALRCFQHRPTWIFCEGFESEHVCWDPKDGELCLSRAKPGETLVEARSDADVQIARRTWV